MKKRSREVNVFSIAALDLFASALGAFILMALVFMVFFSMTAPEASQADDARSALARCRADLAGSVDADELAACRTAAEADLANCEAELAGTVSAAEFERCRTDVAAAEEEKAGLASRLADARIPNLDIVICLDVTSSMQQQIEGLKRQIVELADVLDSLAPSVGLGIVTYGDHLYDEVTTHHPVQSTRDMASLERYMRRLEVMEGLGDGRNTGYPEAVEVGLEVAVSDAMAWRAQSERRDIIVIGDAPAFEANEADAFDLARRFAGPAGQRVSSVMVESDNPERMDDRTEGFLRELAEAGGGSFVNAIQGQTMIASVLLAILDAS